MVVLLNKILKIGFKHFFSAARPYPRQAYVPPIPFDEYREDGMYRSHCDEDVLQSHVDYFMAKFADAGAKWGVPGIDAYSLNYRNLTHRVLELAELGAPGRPKHTFFGTLRLFRKYPYHTDINKPSEIFWKASSPRTKIYHSKTQFIIAVANGSFMFRHLLRNLNEILHCPNYVSMIAGSARTALFVSKDVKHYSEAVDVLREYNPSLRVPERRAIIKEICGQFADLKIRRLISLTELKDLMMPGEKLIPTLRCGGVTQSQLHSLTKQARKGFVEYCRVIGIIAVKLTTSKKRAKFMDGVESKLTEGALLRYYFVYSFDECRHTMMAELVAASSTFVQKSLLRRIENIPHIFPPDFEFDATVLELTTSHLRQGPSHGPLVDPEDLDTQAELSVCDSSFTFFCVNDVSIAFIDDAKKPSERHDSSHYPENQQIFLREESMARWRRNLENQLSDERLPPPAGNTDIWPLDEFSHRLSAATSLHTTEDIIEPDFDAEALKELDEIIALADDGAGTGAKRARFTHGKRLAKDDSVAGPSTPADEFVPERPPSPRPPFDMFGADVTLHDRFENMRIHNLILRAFINRGLRNKYQMELMNQLLRIGDISGIETSHMRKMRRTCARKGSPISTQVRAIMLLRRKKASELLESDIGFVIEGRYKSLTLPTQRFNTHSGVRGACEDMARRVLAYKKEVLPRMVVEVGGQRLYKRLDSSEDEESSEEDAS